MESDPGTELFAAQQSHTFVQVKVSKCKPLLPKYVCHKAQICANDSMMITGIFPKNLFTILSALRKQLDSDSIFEHESSL